MEWELYQKIQQNLSAQSPEAFTPVNVNCPNCGTKIFKEAKKILTSYPPKYKYVCFNCNWRESGF